MLSALTDVCGLILRILVWQLPSLCNYSFGKPDALFWLSQVPALISTYTQTYTYLLKLKKLSKVKIILSFLHKYFFTIGKVKCII